MSLWNSFSLNFRGVMKNGTFSNISLCLQHRFPKETTKTNNTISRPNDTHSEFYIDGISISNTHLLGLSFWIPKLIQVVFKLQGAALKKGSRNTGTTRKYEILNYNLYSCQSKYPNLTSTYTLFPVWFKKYDWLFLGYFFFPFCDLSLKTF